MIIPGAFTPVTDSAPVDFKGRIRGGLGLKRSLDTRDAQQLVKAMGVEIVDECLVWDFILAELSRDARLERAFHNLPEEIVRPGPPRRLKKRFRVGYPNIGEELQVGPVHGLVAGILPCDLKRAYPGLSSDPRLSG